MSARVVYVAGPMSMTLTCRCGKPYTATVDGRHRHRLIHGHTPVVDDEAEQ